MLGLQLVPSADLLESIYRLLSRIFNSLAPKEGSGVGALSGCKMPETEAGRRLDCTTVLVLRMAHRKWKETKQLPSMLPGPAVPGSCLVYFHVLWTILSTSTVQQLTVKDPLRLSFISHTDKRSVQQSSYWGNLPPDTDHYGAGGRPVGWLVGRPEFISFHSDARRGARKLGCW